MIDRLREALQRMRAAAQRGAMENELDAELDSHLTMAIEEKLGRGMSAEEARRQALIEFGGAEQAREQHRQARGLPSLEIFFQDIRYAARGIIKAPGFTAAATLTLALGIAVNATMFSMVSGFLLRRPPGHEPERVAVVSGINPAARFLPDAAGVSVPNYLNWSAAQDVLEKMAASDENRTANLLWQGHTTAVPAAAVTPEYFEVLGVTPQAGRVFSKGDDQPGRDHVVILSQDLWDREFGSDPSVVGRTIRLNREDYAVIGVMPRSFRLMGFTTQLWMPLALSPADQTAEARRRHNLFVFGRMKPGVTLEQTRAEMKAIGQRTEREFPETEKGWGVSIRSLPDFLVYAFGIRDALVVIMAVVGFVLLIACANVAGLLLARAGARRKELAIRMSLGASRARIVRQLLTEGVILALLGGGIGLMMAFWGIRLLAAGMGFNEAVRAVPLTLDQNVLWFALVISMVSAILCSLAPALRASRTDVNSSLKDESRASSVGRSQGRARTILVTGQIAMAMFLLIGTGLLLRWIYGVGHQALGFSSEHLLTASVALDQGRYKEEGERARFVRELLPKLQALPGAESVAAVSDLPATGSPSVTVLEEGQPEVPSDKRPRATYFAASNDFFRAAEIPLLRGRTFTENDNTDAQRVVIVNQEFVHHNLHDENPLGKRIRLDVAGSKGEWSEIVGVVANTKFYSEDSRYEAAVYEPIVQRPQPAFSLMIRTRAEPQGMASALRGAVSQMDVELPLSRVMSMDSVIAEQRGGDELFQKMLASFALLALALAAVGIYGLISYSVGQRTHEIAIRMALGAPGATVRRMVLWQGLKMAVIGAGIGFLAALPLPKVFAAMFNDIVTGDPATEAVVVAAIFVVSMLATYFPARRASAIDPMKALYSE